VASFVSAGSRDQWKNRYRMTSTIAGTPRIQARKYLPMIVLLSFAIDHEFRMPWADTGVRTLVHGVRPTDQDGANGTATHPADDGRACMP
jgi:hypothetical protein